MKFDFELFMQDVHRVSVERGWWEPGDHKTPLECMALIVSEVAEAMEEIRLPVQNPPIYQLHPWGDGGPADVVTPDETEWRPDLKTEGVAVELADAVLRIIDYCEFHKLPLIEAMQRKHEYNKTRSYRHGKKL